jgi:hypothetical protein
MKAYKRFSAAKTAAQGTPILRVSNELFIVGINSADSVSLISPTGQITGHVTLGHLDRLSNANWATSLGGKDFAHGHAFQPDAK